MHDGHDHHPTPPVPGVPTFGPHIVEGPNWIPNYAYAPNTQTLRDGHWFDPAIWSNGVPSDVARVQINHAVSIAPIAAPSGDINGDGAIDVADYLACETVDDYKRFGDAFFGLAVDRPGNAIAAAVLIGPAGCLSVHADASLAVGTLQVLGCFEQFCGDVIFRDLPIDLAVDPMQWGVGILIHSGGKWHGEGGLEGIGENIQRVKPGGVVSSENPNGTRGHAIILHSGTAFLQALEFGELGRTKIGALDNTQMNPDGITAKHVGTNQMARYGGPHFHHCWGPYGPDAAEPAFTVEGCLVRNGRKWGITVHQSHYGRIHGNLVEACGGAGVTEGEDGNETGNWITYNHSRQIFGDGRGLQGHANGEAIRDIGDGSAANPFRTSGSVGNEGSGNWSLSAMNFCIGNTSANCPTGITRWSRFRPPQKRSPRKGAPPSEWVAVAAGQQLDGVFEDNTIRDCPVGMEIQGQDAFKAVRLTIENARTALDSSYNGTLRFDALMLRNCFSCYKNGFTGRIELYGCATEGCNKGFDIPNDIYVEGGTFNTLSTTFIIALKHVTSTQKSMILRGPRFIGAGDHVAYQLGDLNKNRGYHAPRDLLCYDWNGVKGDDFQVWMPQQAADYVPVNRIAPHEVRITPEPGITNATMLDKYLLCLGGRVTPAHATARPKIVGMVMPVLADLSQPEIINLTEAVTATGITVKFQTTKPARFRAEWSPGDIRWGKYANLVLPVGKEFKTSHEFTIGNLAAGKKHGYIIQVVDEHGNLGGDVLVNGYNYSARHFTTRAN
jgi:hypothetical protein